MNNNKYVITFYYTFLAHSISFPKWHIYYRSKLFIVSAHCVKSQYLHILKTPIHVKMMGQLEVMNGMAIKWLESVANCCFFSVSSTLPDDFETTPWLNKNLCNKKMYKIWLESDFFLSNICTVFSGLCTRDDLKLDWTYRNFLDKLGNAFTKPPWHWQLTVIYCK